MDPSPGQSTSRRPPQHKKPSNSRPPVQKPSGKLRGHPKDAEDVRISKTLSWLLRHGAKSEGLSMRADGYVKVVDLLALPKMRSLDFLKLEKLVQDDAKMRYHLLFEPVGEGSGADIWWIRANQGHSLTDVDLRHAEITAATQVPMAVHGTTINAWKSIANQGLSRMTRQHIHLAQGIAGDGVISGMRNSSQVYIYVDLASALRADLKFYLSQNGVVLTPGDQQGFLAPQFFERVVRADGQPIPGWTRPSVALENPGVQMLETDVNGLSIEENGVKVDKVAEQLQSNGKNLPS